jgi:hypothetical protein
MANLQRLTAALQAADAAGDTQAATALAQEIRRVQGEGSPRFAPKDPDVTARMMAEDPASYDPNYKYTPGAVTPMEKAKEMLGRGASAAVRPLVQAIAAPGALVADTAQAYAWAAKKGIDKMRPKTLSDLIAPEQQKPFVSQSQRFNQALDSVTFSPQTTMGRINEGVASALIGSRIPIPPMGKQAPPGFVPPPKTPQAASFAAGRDLGLVAPPASVAPTMGARTLETIGGKVATAQDAAIDNMPKFTSIGKKAIGIADDVQLSPESIDAVRRTAGQAYGEVAGLGKLTASVDDLPKSVRIEKYADAVTLNPRSEVNAAAVVEAWKQANHEATAYYRAFARDANPETLAKAKAAAADAKKIDAFLDKTVQAMGKPDLLRRLKEARVLIAKTHSVEGAMNPSTGVVSGTKLAKQLEKGKPLTGDLKAAAQFAQAFPKASREILDSGSVRNTDLIVGGGTAAVTGQPWYLGYPLFRSAARSTALSPLMQNRLLRPTQPVHPALFGAIAPLTVMD